MHKPPSFNYKDVLWAPISAISIRQITVMTIFLFAGFIVYDIFTYLAYAVDGVAFKQVFSAWGFFPFVLPILSSLLAKIVYVAGIALSVLALMIGFLSVGIINIEAMRGHSFLSFNKAIGFALSRFKQVFLAELSIALFVIFIVIIFSLLGLISRIPYIGEWLYTLLFAIPNFIIALLSVFIIFVFSLTVLLLPAVVAAERKGETFTAILETFSTIILQPFRWIGYTLYSLVAGKLAGFIFAYFAFRAVQFLAWSSSIGGGESITRLIKSSLPHLPYQSDLIRETFYLFPFINIGIDLWNYTEYPAESPISYLMAFMLFVIILSILGYMLTVVAAAQARSYVVLKYLKDHHNIAAEPSLFLKSENENEPAQPDDNSES